MSLRGVRQLKSLTIQYSDIDGSSRGVREWMRTHLVKFAEANPVATIKTEKVRNCHPLLRAFYLNGNKKQISIKNVSSDEVHEQVNIFVLHFKGNIIFLIWISRPIYICTSKFAYTYAYIIMISFSRVYRPCFSGTKSVVAWAARGTPSRCCRRGPASRACGATAWTS